MTVDAVAHTTTYTYNIYSDVLSLTYPSGFVVNPAYDANGYLNTLKNGGNTITLFTNLAMNGLQQYTSYSLGDGKTSINTYYFGTPTRYLTMGVQDLTLTWNYQTGNLNSRSILTNSSGTVVAEQNFDAWGRKRNPTNWTYVAVPTVPAWLYRGFTGHEHLPQFTLINMNGRLYDPIVGRMLSTDNNIQMPDFTQNYNRYSYALNNPLRFTDSDGELIHIIAGALIGGFINGIIHADEGLAGFGKGFLVGAVAGAVIAGTEGAAAVYYATGSLAGALSATAVASATASVAGGAIAAGVGAALGDSIRGFGNQHFFNEPYSLKDYGRNVLFATVSGGY